MVCLHYSDTATRLSCLEAMSCTGNSALYGQHSRLLGLARADSYLCTADSRKGTTSFNVCNRSLADSLGGLLDLAMRQTCDGVRWLYDQRSAWKVVTSVISTQSFLSYL